MATEKLLHSIQDEIRELLPALEVFMDEHVPPGAADCESLKDRLRSLADQLAVYKHFRTQQEITPSFELHARVSEIAAAEAEYKAIQNEIQKQTSEVTPPQPSVANENKPTAAPTIEVKEEVKPSTPIPPEPTDIRQQAPEPVHESPAPVQSPPMASTHKKLQPLAIALNDKFRFINELFQQNGKEFSLAVEQVNSITNKAECEIYLNSLKQLYHWDEQKETVKYFLQLVRNRYA